MALMKRAIEPKVVLLRNTAPFHLIQKHIPS